MVGVTPSDRLTAALALPNGARFYRCALQVNPFAYLSRNGKGTSGLNETDYNNAMIQTCRQVGIEVIGITDHYRVKDSVSLVNAARAAGMFAFSGFEAVTKDGVHFLCLFDPDKDDGLERFIGECGIHDSKSISPTGALDSIELLGSARRWGAVCIAAHAAADGGIFKKLSGQTRVNVWTSQDLLACAIAGPIANAPENVRPILENKDAAHHRVRPVAIVNASDVSSPEDLARDGASCFIKMSNVSVEALRQAFLDPTSRIRLNSEPQPELHDEFVAISWEGGFLGETAIHFNENLNVLVGGKGTGKSTIVESLRYALGLEPIGEEARKAHEGVISRVLRSGTKVSLLVRSQKPSQRCYTIERSVPNPPIVRDESGEVLDLSPRDIMPGVEVFGQHEISELTKSAEKLTLLLERFVRRDPALSGRKAKLRMDLERSRRRVLDARREVTALDERLAALPALEETQKRFQDAGLESQLREKSLIVREEQIFANVAEQLDAFQVLVRELGESLPLDASYVSPNALKGLPNADILSEIERSLAALSADLRAAVDHLSTLLSNADADLATTKALWTEKRNIIEGTYEKLLRDLQKSKIDGAEFIRLRKQIEELRPLRDKKEAVKADLATQEGHRRKLLAEWEDIKANEYREIQSAAKKVSRKLRDRVRVEVTMAGNRDQLWQAFRQIGGNLTAAIERLRSVEQLSLPDLAQRCREGKEALIRHYGLPPGSGERIAQADLDVIMRIEELDLPATTEIDLNTAPEGESPVWQSLEALSSGQKATAVLLLLLLESDAPLVVDQPEDDLDNRFITEGVVPIMRQEKGRRQFVFSTHNANIPVLGDAELILGLDASGDSGEGHTRIALDHMGSIDSRPVCALVEEILEGGRAAFEMRRSKYGF